VHDRVKYGKNTVKYGDTLVEGHEGFPNSHLNDAYLRQIAPLKSFALPRVIFRSRHSNHK
jgi:hypothetical protein